MPLQSGEEGECLLGDFGLNRDVVPIVEGG
jgi:hypothetical protein